VLTRTKTGPKKQRRPRRQISELPPPLPPETRTVGQLVAETLRLYARRFWVSLALGVGPALLLVASFEWRGNWAVAGLVVGSAFVNAAVYIAACMIVLDVRPDRGTLLTALIVGVFVWLPAFFIPILWFSAVGMAVPAALVERRREPDAFRRGFELFRADPAHAIFSVLTLVVVTFVIGAVLFVLLRSGSQQGIRVAAGLASLVLSPILYLGSALLYLDQAARVSSRSPR
jgi:heme/copper-type cytochrome/quinol oxidase subunit 4